MRSYGLPIGLVGALAFALLAPGPGEIAANWHLGPLTLIHLLIGCIFLISGWGLPSNGGISLGGFFRPALTSLALHFVLWPLLLPALTLAILGGLGVESTSLVCGLAIMTAVPTTLSSAIVISRQAGGNEWLAILLTVLLSLAGALFTPLVLKFIITNFNDTPIHGSIFLTLLGTAALPLTLGLLLRRQPLPHGLKWIPNLCIITAVWLSASRHQPGLMATFQENFILLATVAAGLHGLMLSASWRIGAWATTNRRDRLSFTIVGAQKTLPYALGIIASALSGPEAAQAIAFCVVFHFAQILIDSVWASIIKNHHV